MKELFIFFSILFVVQTTPDILILDIFSFQWT